MILSFLIATLFLTGQQEVVYNRLEEIKIEKDCKKCSFKKHFNILDSVVKTNPNDTVYHCCMQSIYFMVKNTKIEVTTDGTLLGRTSFSKGDLEKWHAWYDKKYGKKKVNK